MRNSYSGTCFRCGGYVDAKAGHFEKVTSHTRKKFGESVANDKWLIQHADCAIKYRGTDHIHGGKKTVADDFEVLN